MGRRAAQRARTSDLRRMVSAPSAHRITLCTLLASALLGCEVDNRKLHAGGGDGGSGGTADSSGGNRAGAHPGGRPSAGGIGGTVPTAGTTFGGEGGVAGASSAGAAGSSGLPQLVDGCVDLDQNEIGDCTETLVSNARFEADVDGWLVGAMPGLMWSDQNRADDVPSGSAAVAFTSEAVDTDGLTQAAAVQCLPISGGAGLELRTNAFILPDQGEGLAALGVWFYERDDCSGQALTPYEINRAEADTWLVLSGTSQAPANATSVLVRLAVGKPLRSKTFTVLFDNVLVRTE
jgi:hypothetical protein